MFNLFPTLLVGAFFLASAFGVSAAVLTVTTLADTDDAVCDSQCSLREAIDAASNGDSIIFARDIRGGTIQLTRTLEPAVGKFVKIDGPNRRRITLKGDNTFRIIETHGNLWIDGLIIRDGYAVEKDGGGILATGTLNLTNVAIINNSARRGGGIYISGGGLLILADSLVAGNTANGDSTAGGIDAFFGPSLSINNSTISGNRSLSIIDGVGGMRLNIVDSCRIVSSTIVFNTSNGTSMTSAGGIAASSITDYGAPIANTILAKNSSLNNPDHFRGFSARNSLIGIASPTSGLVNGVNGNIVGSASAPAEPVLGPLVDNGGLQTHAPQTGSPTIDSGNNAWANDRRNVPLVVDQRGFIRIANAIVDMGAHETASQLLVRASTVKGQAINAGGRGIAGARVELRNGSGEVRYAITNPFGFFQFVNIDADQTYSLNCLHKWNAFGEQSVLVEEGTEYVKFVASSQ
jgi:CSLREA domain-containing protein